ncbi:MAG: hypothetical protein QM487_08500 [Candidatus Marithrix sp.]
MILIPQGRVLVNSLPKGGPHLLMSTVEILGYEKYLPKTDKIPESLSNKNVKNALQNNKHIDKPEVTITPFAPLYVDKTTIRFWLDSVPDGQYISGHIPWTSALANVIADLDYRQILIIRDPRALIAAIIFDPSVTPRFLTNDFEAMSLSQRLTFMLNGGYAPKAKVTIKSFAEIYRSILAWQNDSNCLLIRFENLVDAPNGGQIEQQVVKNIASYLNLDNIPTTRLTEIADPNAKTFKIDQIDKWKSIIESVSLERIMEYCEPLCQEAGYQI